MVFCYSAKACAMGFWHLLALKRLYHVMICKYLLRAVIIFLRVEITRVYQTDITDD